MIATLPTAFKVFGTIASGLLTVLSRREHKDDFSKIIRLFNENMPLQEAIKKIMGDQYDDLIKRANEAKSFIYEADEENYYKIEIGTNMSSGEKLDLLRTEFNMNIRGLEVINNQKNVQSLSFTITRKWLKRYEVVLGFVSSDEQNKLKSTLIILDPSVVTYRDLFNIIRPFFGVTSALSFIYSVLLFTAIGMGVMAKISLFLIGIPGGQIVSLVLLSSILAYLATIKIGIESKLQTVINMVYKILDERQCTITTIIKEDNKVNIDILDKLLEVDESNVNIDSQTIISLVGIFKYLTEIDSIVDEREVEEYKIYMKKEFAFADTRIDDYWENTPAIEGLNSITGLNEILNEKQKNNIFIALKAVTVADGELHEYERKFLNDVKLAFEIKPSLLKV